MSWLSSNDPYAAVQGEKVLNTGVVDWIESLPAQSERDEEDERPPGLTEHRLVLQAPGLAVNIKVHLARLRNVLLALATNGIMIWDTSIIYAQDASSKYSVTELLSPDCMRDVAHLTKQRLLLDQD